MSRSGEPRTVLPLALSNSLARVLCVPVLLVVLVGWLSPRVAVADTLPPRFHESTVVSGLDEPTAVRFAPDGRVFVAEKSGLIKTFDSLSDSDPTQVADLRTQVHNFWDRGMLGMTIDPGFATGSPYLYVLYARDAAIGGTPPRWGQAGQTSDTCPDTPGATDDGCVISARLSRIPVDANTGVATGAEQPLVTDWCQQYPSHSIGTVAFGADGALYASAGEGASFDFVDWGQDGDPVNPCGDPPGPPGTALSPPTAEGGALRAQDLRTSGDPTGLSGSVIRVDKATGDPAAGNPGTGDTNARRIVAHGLRNPFRFTVRPGTSELWIGDVGLFTWEEIDRLPDPTNAVRNFGWPCYQGDAQNSGFNTADLDICDNLYADGPGAVSHPYFEYHYAQDVVEGEACNNGSSAIAGLAFYPGGPFPDSYDGALFFTDYARGCIWVIPPGTDGLPDPSQVTTFATGLFSPIELQVGPDGGLYYTDFYRGQVVRIRYFAGNIPPTARATASPTYGAAPLAVDFDGTTSSDPENDDLDYAWDLDGDGEFDDSNEAKPSRTYPAGNTQVRLRVTDSISEPDDSDPITISSGNTPPVATITEPSAALRWSADDDVPFSGSATDAEEGSLGAASMDWSMTLRHCPSSCHSHRVQDFENVAAGTMDMPDHEFPSYIELRLTVTDAGGLQDTESIDLHPKTVALALQTIPGGREVNLNGHAAAAPLTATVIAGSNNTIGAPSPQVSGPETFYWTSWSDAGQQTHNVNAGAMDRTLTATFTTGAFATFAQTPPTINESPAGVPPDRRAPATRLSFRWTDAVRHGYVSAFLSCPGEPCTVTARGSLVLGGASRRYRLATVTRRLPRGKRVRLLLRLSPSARRKLLAARRRHRSATFTVLVTAKDRSGNASRRRVTGRLSG